MRLRTTTFHFLHSPLKQTAISAEPQRVFWPLAQITQMLHSPICTTPCPCPHLWSKPTKNSTSSSTLCTHLVGNSLLRLNDLVSSLSAMTRSKRTLSLIHISEPTRQAEISYAVFC